MNILLSYLVHLFTLSGVLLSFLALNASINEDLPLAFFYLAIALFVDGIDGTLARKVDVVKNTPHINGEILDNIIDFLSYVFIPAFIVFWLGFVPEGLELISAFIILIVSCYTFANNNLKTQDYYFSGFPALWNIYVLYCYLLDTTPYVNFAVLCLLAIFTFVPLKYVHPFRVNFLRKTSLFVITIWMITAIEMLYIEIHSELISQTSFSLWVATNIYFMGLTIYRSFLAKS